MSVLDHLKTGAAIAGSVIGISGGAFALGSTIGRTPIEARLDAHLAPEVIHAESAKRIESIKIDVKQAENAAREAAAESRRTRDALRQLAKRIGGIVEVD